MREDNKDTERLCMRKFKEKMTEDERRYQTDIFKDAIFKCIDENRKFQLTYAEVIGVLDCVKVRMMVENGIIPDFE